MKENVTGCFFLNTVYNVHSNNDRLQPDSSKQYINAHLTDSRSTSIAQQTSIESSPADINWLDVLHSRTLRTLSLQPEQTPASSLLSTQLLNYVTYDCIAN